MNINKRDYKIVNFLFIFVNKKRFFQRYGDLYVFCDEVRFFLNKRFFYLILTLQICGIFFYFFIMLEK
ncbi:MAG: hypothetical protein BGO07_00130 [Alphaproteobacteria bacterium 40-19]|nr:MAG: hypothetical protein BGO07_00130 [Alphaproteobacteria bacterium 40-19]